MHLILKLLSHFLSAFVSESAENGTYIAHITATDSDYGKNGQVVIEVTTHLMLHSQDKRRISNIADLENYFVLEDQSFLKTNHLLDREELPQFVIRIQACDRALPPLYVQVIM